MKSNQFFITLILLLSTGLASARAFAQEIHVQVPPRVDKEKIMNGAINRVKHNLNKNDLDRLIALALEGKPIEGWKKLAELGDQYSDDAYNVVKKHTAFPASFLYNLVKANWKNTAGAEAYEKRFNSFAVQHFRQYVSILSTGYWPDAEQICLSYRKSAEDHNIPVSVITDGILTASGINQIISWQSMVGLERGRKPGCTAVFRDIPMNEALWTLANDVIDTVQRADSYGTFKDLLKNYFPEPESLKNINLKSFKSKK